MTSKLLLCGDIDLSIGLVRADSVKYWDVVVNGGNEGPMPV